MQAVHLIGLTKTKLDATIRELLAGIANDKAQARTEIAAFRASVDEYATAHPVTCGIMLSTAINIFAIFISNFF